MSAHGLGPAAAALLVNSCRAWPFVFSLAESSASGDGKGCREPSCACTTDKGERNRYIGHRSKDLYSSCGLLKAKSKEGGAGLAQIAMKHAKYCL